ncbi:hypothetical protein [Aurantimonas sp. 22II-16-19i]|uniref:hypothetical protein n=1 Tax=Aurantimonas sp. 22II-16-19i TaxID=1317114 RepID=UPI0009FAF64E|nr:hypothetical protein [Aurantimonas sp. 22II-16-19i]
MKRAFTILAICLVLTACTTPSITSPVETKEFGFPGYALAFERQACDIRGARLVSSGPAIPAYTYHQLIIAANGVTSGTYSINCPPVVAGGAALCLVQSENFISPEESAGPNCARWSDIDLRRRG